MRRLVDLAESVLAGEDPPRFLGLLVAAVVDLTAATAAAVLVLEPGGPARIVASSSPQVHALEAAQLTHPAGGPCLECMRLARALTVPDLRADPRWPALAPLAEDAGIHEVHALPLIRRGALIGALNVFGGGKELVRRDHQVADLLGDLATVALTQERIRSRERTEVEQLRLALESRVVIEQAKGLLAQHAGLDMAGAFEVLRRYSRHHRLPLHEVSQRLANRLLAPAEVVAVVADQTSRRRGGDRRGR